MKAGAVDYVQKPYDISALIARLQRAINERVGLAEKISWPELAMVSAGMLDLGRRLERLAAINVSALIVGESGSGKEIVARHTHRLPPHQRSLRRCQVRQPGRPGQGKAAVR